MRPIAVAAMLALCFGGTPARADRESTMVLWIQLDPLRAHADLEPALSAEALDLRSRMGIGLLDTDRPLRPDLLGAIERAGARIRVASPWLHAVSAEVTPPAARRLRQIPEVIGTRPVAIMEVHAGGTAPAGLPAPPMLAEDDEPGTRPQPSAMPVNDNFYGLALAAMRQLAVDQGHELGFVGRGVRIAVIDAGFLRLHEAVAPLDVVATRDFIHGDTMVADRPGEPPGGELQGTRTLSLMAGYAPERLVGPAPGAEFLLAKVDRRLNVKTAVDEDRWVAALQWADSLGARIVHSSLGYRLFNDRESYTTADLNGQIAASTLAAREAARRGILIVTAVGDRGPQGGSLVAPADAAEVLAVGAVDAQGSLLLSSSRGPTGDGRIKPDLVAPGVDVPAANQVGEYQGFTGTDRAAAYITGIAALMLEAWPEFDGAQVRDALLRSASLANAPNFGSGYGLPDVARALVFPDGIRTQPVAGADAAGVLRSLAPLFRWEVPRSLAAARPVLYRFELATDADFNHVLFADTLLEGFASTLSRALRPTPTLWWRVVAEAADGAIRRATPPAGPLLVPSWVQLRTLHQASDQFSSSTRPRLTWSALPAPMPVGPLTFDVQILTGPNGTVVQTMNGITDTTVTVRDALDYNTAYRWRVIARSPAGVADTVESVAPFVVTSTSHPPATLLYQSFPNEFPRRDLGLHVARIWFDLDQRTPVELAIFDLQGRVVRRLIPAAPGCGVVVLEPGLYGRDPGLDNTCMLTYWDGNDESGRQMPAGVYVYRLNTGRGQFTRQMLFHP